MRVVDKGTGAGWEGHCRDCKQRDRRGGQVRFKAQQSGDLYDWKKRHKKHERD